MPTNRDQPADVFHRPKADYVRVQLALARRLVERGRAKVQRDVEALRRGEVPTDGVDAEQRRFDLGLAEDQGGDPDA
jgi:hypothetical protein